MCDSAFVINFLVLLDVMNRYSLSGPMAMLDTRHSDSSRSGLEPDRWKPGTRFMLQKPGLDRRSTLAARARFPNHPYGLTSFIPEKPLFSLSPISDQVSLGVDLRRRTQLASLL